jgi:hypothetical protein
LKEKIWTSGTGKHSTYVRGDSEHRIGRTYSRALWLARLSAGKAGQDDVKKGHPSKAYRKKE